MDDMYDNLGARDYDDPVSPLPPLPDPLPGFDLPGPSNPRSSTVFLSSESKRVRIKTSQVTPALLGKVFSFFPGSVFLISDSGQVVTADSEGNFDPAELEAEDWNCHGNSITPPGGNPANPLIEDSENRSENRDFKYCYQQRGKQKNTKGKWTPYPKLPPTRSSKPPGVVSEQLFEWNKTIEIFRYRDSSWEKTGNFPIRLNERKATVPSVGNIASQEAFGGKECVILDLDFLKGKLKKIKIFFTGLQGQ